MNAFSIGHRIIGPEHPPLVIAEIGINHNGSLETACEMAHAAINAGAEVIKHQTHIVSDEMSHEAMNVVPGNSDRSIYDIMKDASLSENEERQLKSYVESLGAIFISTPFSRAAADRLEKFDVPAYKIGSGEFNNIPLIEHIASFGKPMILSTGMNDIKMINKVVGVLETLSVPFALLHTTNLYPTPIELVRLGAMTEIANNFPGVIFGLSDHTTDNLACLAATALGASILERHFTDTMNRQGPDIVCSMDPDDCRRLIHDSATIWKMRGGSKVPAEEEQITMNFAFATVVTIQEIKAGETLTMENVWVKRPGTGEIPATEFSKVLGKKVNKNIDNDTHLMWMDIDNA